jgi:hypothetical protein
MKRILIAMVLLFLVACGQGVHENINETMAEDATNLMDIMSEVVKEERDLTEREKKAMEDFILLYGGKYDLKELTEEEERLYLVVFNIIDMKDSLLYVKSNKEDFNNQKQMVMNVINNGTIYDK